MTNTNRAAMIDIPEKLFFKIGEVCDIVGIQAHVLRYWESEFSMLSPQKNRAGQRTYRRRDVEMVLRIKELLYEEQYTIPGARKRLLSDMRGASKLKVVTPEMSAAATTTAASSTTALAIDYAPNSSATLAPSLQSPAKIQVPSVESSDEQQPTNSRLTPHQRRAVLHLRHQLHDLMLLLERDGA